MKLWWPIILSALAVLSKSSLGHGDPAFYYYDESDPALAGDLYQDYQGDSNPAPLPQQGLCMDVYSYQECQVCAWEISRQYSDFRLGEFYRWCCSDPNVYIMCKFRGQAQAGRDPLQQEESNRQINRVLGTYGDSQISNGGSNWASNRARDFDGAYQSGNRAGSRESNYQMGNQRLNRGGDRMDTQRGNRVGDYDGAFQMGNQRGSRGMDYNGADQVGARRGNHGDDYIGPDVMGNRAENFGWDYYGPDQRGTQMGGAQESNYNGDHDEDESRGNRRNNRRRRGNWGGRRRRNRH